MTVPSKLQGIPTSPEQRLPDYNVVYYPLHAGQLLATCIERHKHGYRKLGKHAMESLLTFMDKKNIGRRSTAAADMKIAATVKKAAICRELNICEGKFEFVDDYVSQLGNAVESIFDGIIKPKGVTSNDAPKLSKGEIFEDPLKALLRDLKKLFKAADSKVTKDREAFIWIDLLKKVSARFHDSTLSFLHRRLEGDPIEMKDVKKRLTQKLVLAISIIEHKFEKSLCVQYKLCDKQLEVTSSLRRFFEYFADMTDSRARVFMQYFYESLPDTLHFLSEETAKDFQVVLRDMVYSEKVPTKEILLSVLKTVEERPSVLNSQGDVKTYDVLLANVILSDLDHFYNGKQRENYFEPFLSYFNDWTALGGRFHAQITSLLKGVRDHLQNQPGELYTKLLNQVRVFLELTVDSEQ